MVCVTSHNSTSLAQSQYSRVDNDLASAIYHPEQFCTKQLQIQPPYRYQTAGTLNYLAPRANQAFFDAQACRSISTQGSSSTSSDDQAKSTENSIPCSTPAKTIKTKSQKKASKIKRPMNVFMVWARLNRKRVAEENKTLTNSEISKLLGQIWKKMSEDEKVPFKKISDEITREHKELHPDYRYRPRRRVVKKSFTCGQGKETEKKGNVFWDLTVMNHPGMVPRPCSFTDIDLMKNYETHQTNLSANSGWNKNYRSVHNSSSSTHHMSTYYKLLQPIRQPYKSVYHNHRLFHEKHHSNVAAPSGFVSSHLGYIPLHDQIENMQHQIGTSFQNLYEYSLPYAQSSDVKA